MSASTTAADGTRYRYHAGPPFITECAIAECERPHASKAELNTFGSPVEDARRRLGEGPAA